MSVTPVTGVRAAPKVRVTTEILFEGRVVARRTSTMSIPSGVAHLQDVNAYGSVTMSGTGSAGRRTRITGFEHDYNLTVKGVALLPLVTDKEIPPWPAR